VQQASKTEIAGYAICIAVLVLHFVAVWVATTVAVTRKR
jgi:hypothetical protein